MSQSPLSETTRALIDIAWHVAASGPQGQCCAGLSIAEFLALDKVARTADCPVQTVGSELGFTKSGATRIVTRLEKRALVQRVQSPSDGRVCCVHITRDGREVLAEANALFSAAFDEARSRMPSELGGVASEVIEALARTFPSVSETSQG